jgi:hypothetical protein
MTNLLLVGVIICQLLPLLFVLIAVMKLKSSLLENVRSFFIPQVEGKQSSFADILDNISSRFASAMIASLKGFLMAENSAVVRQDKAAVRQQLVGDNPMLAGLAAFAPGLMRKFGKNPEILQMGLNMLQNAGKPREEASAGNNGGSSANPFKI